MHTLAELQEKQALPLDIKIMLTRERVRKWINEFGEDGVYISFSGGKDSTVLLDLVRNEFGYKNIKAMFVDAPTQYPELRSFVKTFDNVDIVTPKSNFFQACEKYGFPLFSKEISECVQGARKYLTSILNEQTPLTDRQTVPLLVRKSARNREVQESISSSGRRSTEKANTGDYP